MCKCITYEALFRLENLVKIYFVHEEKTQKKTLEMLKMSSLKVLSFGFVTYRFKFEYFSDS